LWRPRPPPPPLRSLFPWWRRDHVYLPPWGSGRGGVDVPLAPRRAALALRRGRPLAPPPNTLVVPLACPLRSRSPPGAAIAFGCRRRGGGVADVRHLI
jgi:hypothetical protein